MDKTIEKNIEFNHVEEIISNLSESGNEAYLMKLKGNASWTKLIKQNLSKLGAELGFETCASGTDYQTHNEWLYDLIWFKEEGEGMLRRMIDVPLIMESEWNLSFDDIKYDFEKLLLGNSPVKLMICQSKSPNELFPYFEDSISKFMLQRTNETYIIAILDHWEEKFEFKTITT
jgi:hypothetical protein